MFLLKITGVYILIIVEQRYNNYKSHLQADLN